MRQVDTWTAQEHLTDAIQHLATAGVVVRHLDRTTQLTSEDRIALAESASQVQSMLYRVNDAVNSRSLPAELTSRQARADGTSS